MKAQQAIFDFADKFPVYVYQWEDGNLLVWHNAQLMHKDLGFGNYAGLLLKAQSRVTPFYKDLFNQYTK